VNGSRAQKTSKFIASAVFSVGLIFSFLMNIGCYLGPKPKDDSILKRLNGATYEEIGSMGPFVVGKANLTRSVRGQVQCNPGLDQVPINHAQVDLYSDGRLIETTFTDRQGYFALAFENKAGHYYELRIFTSKWKRSLKLVPEGRGIAAADNNLLFVECSSKP
jgi:hypothetical protein